jgi:serine/threonine-protein kinase
VLEIEAGPLVARRKPDSADRHERVKEIFFTACGMSAAERKAYLDEQCAGDEALRSEVESLLGYHDRSRNRLAEADRQ